MTNLWIFLTASNCLTEGCAWANVGEAQVEDLSLVLSHGYFEVWGGAQEALWLRPRADDPEADSPASLASRTGEIVVEERREGAVFSLSIEDRTVLSFELERARFERYLVFVRHWLALEKIETPFSGWWFRVGDARGQATSYLGDENNQFQLESLPNCLLAGLRANDEVYLRGEGGIAYLEALLPESGGNLSPSAVELENGGIDRRGDQDWAANGHRGRALRDNSEAIELCWLYTSLGEEGRAGRRACTLVQSSGPQLAVIDSREVLSSRREGEAGVAHLLDSIEHADVVLMHGSDQSAPRLKERLIRKDVLFVDYSPSGRLWRESIGGSWEGWQTAEDVRTSLLAFTRAYLAEGPAEFARRILHRAVNRLAPLSIDLSVLGDLVGERDREGLVAHLSEMHRAWQTERLNNPELSVSLLRAMLIGEVWENIRYVREELAERFFLDSDGALVHRMGGEEILSEPGRIAWYKVLEKVGVRKWMSGYEVMAESEIQSYCRAISRLVQADEKEKWRLSGEVMRRFRDAPSSDVVAAWAGLGTFSYWNWLQDVSQLLEQLYEEFEAGIET